MIAHQATCVAIAGRGLLIEGAPGSGKTSLALALIDRGAELVGDDGVLLERRGRRLIAHPHPATRGLIEIRNLGIVPMPARDAVPLVLLIRLDPQAPRYIEAPGLVERAGAALPAVAIWPSPEPPTLKAEYALRLFGLP